MKIALAIALLLACAACSQQDAPAEEIAEAAEEIVDPTAAEPAPLAKGRYAPRDDCADIAGAADFRDRLASAVKARDADALVALAADDVELDFGGGGGTAQLRALLDEPSGGLWRELADLMELGCAANEQGGITLPWFFEQDLGLADPASAMLVTGEDVPVRQRGDLASPASRTLSWDLVDIVSLDPEKPLQQVTLADQTEGFIPTDKLRSLLGYRLIASSRNGKWSITSLIAGD